jgi:hypothetical protein
MAPLIRGIKPKPLRKRHKSKAGFKSSRFRKKTPLEIMEFFYACFLKMQHTFSGVGDTDPFKPGVPGVS